MEPDSLFCLQFQKKSRNISFCLVSDGSDDDSSRSAAPEGGVTVTPFPVGFTSKTTTLDKTILTDRTGDTADRTTTTEAIITTPPDMCVPGRCGKRKGTSGTNDPQSVLHQARGVPDMEFNF